MTAPTTTVGITGHISLSRATRAEVAAEITRVLSEYGSATMGYTSLAPGSDQIFAWSTLAVGGRLVFVRPCEAIADTIPADNRAAFHAAAGLAAETITMPHTEPSEQAYFDAGAHIADTVDLLIAVWDGKPAGGFGGTADIVERRQAAGRPLIVVWPERASRE